ncbi:hypothetical protein EMIT0111MI5_10784 [Burkholderia sp. IT-111MI5]
MNDMRIGTRRPCGFAYRPITPGTRARRLDETPNTGSMADGRIVRGQFVQPMDEALARDHPAVDFLQRRALVGIGAGGGRVRYALRAILERGRDRADPRARMAARERLLEVLHFVDHGFQCVVHGNSFDGPRRAGLTGN